MKKLLTLLIAAAFALAPLTACNNTQGTPDTENQKLKVVATTFPQYDWLRQIIGDSSDGVELTLLIDNGVDLHSYQPTADDIASIAASDLFVYIGGTSDVWIDDVLRATANNRTTVVNLMDALKDSAKEEVIKEGMEHDHGSESGHDDDSTHGKTSHGTASREGESADVHNHEGEEGPSHDNEGNHSPEGDGHSHEGEEGNSHENERDHTPEGEFDEHIWLSLKNAKAACAYLADELGRLDPESAAIYQANAAVYGEKLQVLDREYQAAVDEAAHKTLLFGDRFPFRYLVDDYGIDYFAAFPGCSAETEASFETVIFLAAKVDELKLRNVMTMEGSDHSIAKTIIQNTSTKDQDVLTMDSMQSVTATDIASGTTYLSIMEDNLEVLKTALR